MQPAAAFVQVSGPDPRLGKAVGRAFHVSEGGFTTISASGIALNEYEHIDAVRVVTVAATILPYVKQAARSKLLNITQTDLIDSTRVDVFWEGLWCQAELIQCFEVPCVSDALSSWCTAEDNNWGLAWGLGNGAQNVTPQMQAHIVELLCTPRQPCEMAAFKAAKATAQKLQFALECDVPQGAPVTAVGSPFGVISPPHFVNSVFHGVISNQWPCNKSEGASGRPDLLMADIRCLPGMEGAPVFDQQGRVVAMMLVPLWSKTFKAEVPLLMPIGHLAAEWASRRHGTPLQHSPPVQKASLAQLALTPAQTQGVPARTHMTPDASSCLAHDDLKQPARISQQHSPRWAAALPSIVLVSAAGSGWASGIVLSRDGHILTNAHVVKPSLLRAQVPVLTGHLQPHHTSASLPVLKVCLSSSSSSRRWHNAEVVYSFQHALDLAVLHIITAPSGLKLQPAVLQSRLVSPGQAVAVLGHALFSPERAMRPTLTAGNITKVVYCNAVKTGDSRTAAMLMTSATVHAGASGGAVVTADGCIAGITTSNARHSGSGSTIPNLNFAVAADTLRPLWALADQPGGLCPESIQQLDVQDAALSSIFMLSQPPEQLHGAGQHKLPGSRDKQGSARLAELLSQKGLSELHLPQAAGKSAITGRLSRL